MPLLCLLLRFYLPRQGFLLFLHLRAYNLIHNEWFRDENLQDSVFFDPDENVDDINNYTLLRRGKRHDYFTSCLPFPQKGPDVELPLGTYAPVVLNNDASITNPWLMKAAASGHALLDNQTSFGTTVTTARIEGGAGGGPTYTEAVFDPNGTLRADLSAATAATINDLRLAFQTQKLYERDARGGIVTGKQIGRAHV